MAQLNRLSFFFILSLVVNALSRQIGITLMEHRVMSEEQHDFTSNPSYNFILNDEVIAFIVEQRF